ncbi:MAG: hypothetical protein K0U74_03225 [Alphaproteobacteria bacterium]|nr:hypothetical protein [Alphaproteobacteria bacterium]
MPTIKEVAERERRYAAACRSEAKQLELMDAEHAALLRLDADLCEMWADEVESGSKTGHWEYQNVLERISLTTD